MDTLEWLAAIEQIKQLRGRYCRGIDTKDWVLLESTLSPDIELILPSLQAAGRQVKGPEQFLSLVREWFSEAASLHASHLPEITIHDADHASGIWAQENFLKPLYRPGEHHGHSYGYSHDQYTRINGQWRVARVRLQPLFIIE